LFSDFSAPLMVNLLFFREEFKISDCCRLERGHLARRILTTQNGSAGWKPALHLISFAALYLGGEK